MVTRHDPFSAKPKPEDMPNVPIELLQGVADMATFTNSGKRKEGALKLGSEFEPDQIADALGHQHTLSKVNIHALPGNSPEEKAAAFGKLYGKNTPYIRKWQSPEYQQSQIDEAIEAINETSEALEELEAPGGNKFAEKHLNPSNKPIRDLLEDLTDEQLHLLRGLAIIKNVGFSLKGKQKKKVVGEGSLMEFRNMTSFDDIALIEPHEIKMPDFRERLVDHNFQIPETYKLEEGEKKVYGLLVDRSGSMSRDRKIGIVRAMLAMLFEEVRKGEAVVYVSTFEESIDGWEKVSTEEEADKVFLNWKEPRGGGTEVGDVIIEAQNDLRLNKLGPFEIPVGSEPELIILNDGQDEIKPVTTFAPIHALSIEQDNEDLRHLCESSGGSFNLIV